MKVESFRRDAAGFLSADDQDGGRVDEGHAVQRHRKRQLGLGQDPTTKGQLSDRFLHDVWKLN